MGGYMDNSNIYYFIVIIFVIIIFTILYYKDKRDKRKMQIDIDRMIELDIMPKRKGDGRLRAEFEMRRSTMKRE
jgi:hypothetical protein